jgi:hypothetical protein
MTDKAPIIDAIIRGPKLFPWGIRWMSELLVGDPVGLFREPDNPVDSNAVFVTDQKERPFGYIQREKASELALWMDRGWFYTAKVIKAATIIYGKRARFIKQESLIVRLTPIPPAQRSTSISVFTDLLVTKVKDLETID